MRATGGASGSKSTTKGSGKKSTNKTRTKAAASGTKSAYSNTRSWNSERSDTYRSPTSGDVRYVDYDRANTGASGANVKTRPPPPPTISFPLRAGIAVLATTVVLFVAWAVHRAIRPRPSASNLLTAPVSTSVASQINPAHLPVFVNGSEYGISMWIYIQNLSSSAPGDSTIIEFGNKPFVRLKNNSSKIEVVFPTLDGGGAPTGAAKAHATWGYVSSRKWVHLVAMHMGGTITIWQDGELYDVGTTEDTIVELSGTGIIGKDRVDAVVSNIAILTRYPSTAALKRLYAEGPRTGTGFMGTAISGATPPCARSGAR